jgi:hypothetical protein
VRVTRLGERVTLAALPLLGEGGAQPVFFQACGQQSVKRGFY